MLNTPYPQRSNVGFSAHLPFRCRLGWMFRPVSGHRAAVRIPRGLCADFGGNAAAAMGTHAGGHPALPVL